MFFCPNCHNALYITQDIEDLKLDKQTETSETPTALSSTEEKDVATLQDKNKTTKKKTANIDVNTGSAVAYMKCGNCSHIQEVTPGTLIFSRASDKNATSHNVEKELFSDMIYDESVPHTRNYICPNKTCESHNDHSLRDAIWFKPYRHTYETIYVCCACKTTW